MILNRDYRRALEGGARISWESRQAQLDSAYLVAVSIVSCAILILLAVMRGGA